MYDIILFDLDETLLDHTYSENQSLIRMHEDFYPSIDYETFKETFQDINNRLWQRVGARQNALTPGQVRIMRFQRLNEAFKGTDSSVLLAEIYEKHLGDYAEWLPEVQSAIAFLHQKGHILGVVTNGLVSVQDKKYDRHQLHKWFDCFIVSDRINVAKPQRHIFEVAVHELADKHQLDRSAIWHRPMIMVGDSYVSDGGGAANVNIDFCYINKERKELPGSEVTVTFDIASVAHLPSCIGYENEYALFKLSRDIVHP